MVLREGDRALKKHWVNHYPGDHKCRQPQLKGVYYKLVSLPALFDNVWQTG